MGDVYLVTGGAGFIGQHLVSRLLELGQTVRVIDNLSTGRRRNLASLMARITFFEADITDPQAMDRATAGVDYVLHQAALPSVPRSVDDPLVSDWNNTRGTLQVLVSARDAGVKRVVLASSSSVWGDKAAANRGVSTARAPRSPYACTKAVGEMYGQAFWLSYGLDVVALRYFNVFGEGQCPAQPYVPVIPAFIMANLSGEAPVIHGDGYQSRDFCHVDNVVQANLLACEAPDIAGQFFDIGCGHQASLLQVLDKLRTIMGEEVAPLHEPDRAGDVKHTRADIAPARQQLGYEPKVLLAEGLRRTVRWHRRRAAQAREPVGGPASTHHDPRT